MHDYPSRSRQTFGNYEEALSNGKRSYNFQNMQKSVQLSQTDKRIQEIKRKYDTPNRRQRISQLSVKKSDFSNNKENQNYGTADFKTRIPIHITQTQNSDAGLRQSKATNNSRLNFYNNPSVGSKSFMAAGNYRQRQSLDYKLPSNKLYTNENEEQFFKRVKEMKQSLLYGDNGPKVTEMKGSTFYPTNKQSRTRSGFYDSTQTVEKDRIDNIDKINQKIKGILQCLNENEKTRVPAKHDVSKRNKVQIGSTIEHEPTTKLRDQRDYTKTPVKSIVTSSMIGRENLGQHRHQRSQILDKIQINRDFKDETKKQNSKEDEKWQKLSSKLEKYELQNKLRMQKAMTFAQDVQPQTSSTQNLVENIRRQRAGTITNNDVKRTNQIIRRDNRSMDMKDFRSRSFLNCDSSVIKDTRDRSLYARDLTQKKEYAMKSGKKLDDEIDRIQKKIQQFEEEKKRLGVNFTPFNYSNTKSASNIGLGNIKNDYSQRKISDFNRNITRNDNPSYTPMKQQNFKAQFGRVEQEDTFRQRKEGVEKEKNQQNSFSRLQSKIQIKLEKSNPSSVRTSKFISQGSSRVSNPDENNDSFAIESRKITQEPRAQTNKTKNQYKNQFSESLKKQTDQGIEERKKRLMDIDENSRSVNTELKSLVKSLCDQVKLDEDFRNAKIWFEYSGDLRKEQQVQKLMPGKSTEQVRQILKVRESQNNPFFTTQGYESSFEKLVDLYNRSEAHWKQNLCQKYDFTSLERQGFTSREIDLQKKGHISLGDLVRFLNLQSGTFYRNRDLSLVFIRICKAYKSSNFTEVDFDWLKNTFCA